MGCRASSLLPVVCQRGLRLIENQPVALQRAHRAELGARHGRIVAIPAEIERTVRGMANASRRTSAYSSALAA